MFDNIGGKMMSLAVTVCVLGIIASVISGIVSISSGMTFAGITMIVVGSLFAWIGSWMMYAVGKTASDVEQIKEEVETLSLAVGDMRKKQHTFESNATENNQSVSDTDHFSESKNEWENSTVFDMELDDALREMIKMSENNPESLKKGLIKLSNENYSRGNMKSVEIIESIRKAPDIYAAIEEYLNSH